ncbi:hypothetical protein BJX61DRAFT_516392 [Aspergillus egyptiacus]|nr:hypothetical protein BJX61DRAFT_516392 [Aspergillus egyptiacus]
MFSAVATSIQTICQAILVGVRVVFWPWSLNHALFKHAISMDESQTVKERVEGWCEAKSAELTTVSISGGLTAAVVTQLFSWSESENPIPEFSRICWYSGLVLVLTAVTLATQQNIALSRARASPRGWAYIRNILNVDGDKIDSTEQRPSRMQLYIWQVPVMLQNFSNLLLVVGILALVLRNESTTVSQAFRGRGGCLCWGQLPGIDARLVS